MKVDELLLQLNPLRAEKYLESNPTTQPAGTVTLKVTTTAPGGTPVKQYTVTITDPGAGKTPIATSNGLTFEVSRTVLEKLEGDFTKSAASANPQETQPGPGFPEMPR
jgi:hypothetical protein